MLAQRVSEPRALSAVAPSETSTRPLGDVLVSESPSLEAFASSATSVITLPGCAIGLLGE
jgi:hypothetical protein